MTRLGNYKFQKNILFQFQNKFQGTNNNGMQEHPMNQPTIPKECLLNELRGALSERAVSTRTLEIEALARFRNIPLEEARILYAQEDNFSCKLFFLPFIFLSKNFHIFSLK